jgi:hypothetical protein
MRVVPAVACTVQATSSSVSILSVPEADDNNNSRLNVVPNKSGKKSHLARKAPRADTLIAGKEELFYPCVLHSRFPWHWHIRLRIFPQREKVLVPDALRLSENSRRRRRVIVVLEHDGSALATHIVVPRAPWRRIGNPPQFQESTDGT